MKKKLIYYDKDHYALLLDKKLLEVLGLYSISPKIIDIKVEDNSLVIKCNKEVIADMKNNDLYQKAKDKIEKVAKSDIFQKELQKISIEYKDKLDSIDFIKAVQKLRYKYVPELEDFENL